MRIIALASASLSIAVVQPSIAATFDQVRVEKFDNWSAVLYRNTNGNRLFCAVESYMADSTVFRIVRYKASGETFMEIHNRSWSLIESDVRFRLDFSIETESYSAELAGRSWPDAYTHDFTTNDNYMLLLGLMVKADSISVKNSNSTEIARFAGRGSEQAITSYMDCLNTDWTAAVPAAPPYQFTDFPAEHRFNGRTLLPDFTGRDRDYRTFRTRISEGMAEGPEFASHYSLITIGCGTQCSIAFIGDNNTGKIYDVPLGGEENPLLQFHININSRLVVSQWASYSRDTCIRQYYEWSSDELRLLGAIDVGTKDDCYSEIPPH